MAAPVLFGLHMPKCGGTTLIDRALQELADFKVYQSSDLTRNYYTGKMEFLQLPRYDQLEFIFGHIVHEQMLRVLPRPAILFTGLREPVSRLRSDIDYANRVNAKRGFPPIDVDRHQRLAKDLMCNYITHRFPTLSKPELGGTPADRAMRVLENFNWCYFMDNFEETAQMIFRFLGIAPKRVDSNEGSDSLQQIQLDTEILRWDLELYDRARQRFRNANIEEAFAKPKEAIVQFANGVPDFQPIRSLFYKATYMTFGGMSHLDQVIQEKIRIANEIMAEVEIFHGLRSKSEPVAFW